MKRAWWLPAALVALLILAGCAGDGGRRDGGRYAMRDDAYPDSPPDVTQVPDAVPRVEPRAKSGNRPTYRVWGKTYHVLSDPRGYAAEGTASWYGKKFQGYDTASGEPYDMYKMSAAHRTLPLPTYAQVTNLDNGRTVIVRVNDRGPFKGNRLIDLSYAAAARLGILRNGTGKVRVEAIDPVAWQAEYRQNGADKALASGETSPGKGPAERPEETRLKAPDAPVRAGGDVAKALPAAGQPQPVAEPVQASAASRIYLQVAALSSAASAERLKSRLQQQLARPVRIARDDRLYRVQVGPVANQSALKRLRSELRKAGYAQAFSVSAGR
ncbi:MAG: rare lipoprotein A [Halomonadaceae bacterium T82-2]|nr:MAG: rare lipoprotein A [Halomonadaceae bacterium T82-2]